MYLAIAVLLSIACFIAGLSVLGFQVYSFLKLGSWSSLSVVSALQWGGVEWATQPTDWAGAHRLLHMLPLSVGFLIAGVLVAAAYSWSADLLEKK